ncbi:MAG: response regulator [Marinifilaceae bacterium]|nr:response regulator [Marinifilaceae bacterium]
MDTQEKSKSDFIKELHKLQQEFNSLTILYDKNIAEQKLAKQELLLANKELVYQNELKEKRAAELVLANKELVYQNELKEKRAAELIVANEELAYQNKLKEKRAVELVNAKNKAEASDHLKTAFMNNISHEIRTPLNGILGFAPLIIQSDITMEEKEEFLEILNSSSDRLLNTINAIMDISLIISGNMEVHPQPINISSLLTNTYHNFQESCIKKNVAVKMQFPDNVDNFILNTDGELLQKAVSKLVSNAVKFTTKGSITLGFELINNEIEIFVKDTGIGIEKDSQNIIYKSFMQENISDTRGHEGSGLGLSISKGIIQLLGGKIRLESTKDIGTTVFLSIPNIAPAVSSKPIKENKTSFILIAEDDDSCYYFEEILLKNGNKILRACNGQKAVDLCKIHPDITLVLMDIKMPVMDGIEATHLIKSFRKDLPIVAVTAHEQNEDAFKIKEAGCDEYISKPIKKAKLLSLIQKYSNNNYELVDQLTNKL